jgi:3-oxoadipate enol-lactonase
MYNTGPVPFLNVPGARLCWESHGPDAAAEGRPPSVVLLHGLGSSAADWFFQVPAFAARHRVLAPDLPGHGRSTADRPLSVEDMAAAVAALLERLGEPAAHVVGLSLGGCVALTLAAREPERVRSLVLVNAFARLRPAGPRGAARLLARLGLLAVAPMPVVAAQVARGLFPRPDQRALYERAVASLAANPRRRYLAALGAAAAFDGRAALASIHRPTLIVAGERDATVPRAAAERLARGIAGARLVVVPDSGHATPADQPEVFNRVVLDFLAAA